MAIFQHHYRGVLKETYDFLEKVQELLTIIRRLYVGKFYNK